MFASTFSLFVDAAGKTDFQIYSGDKPTGEIISYLTAQVDGKTYRYGFNPKEESIQDVIPKLQDYINKETGAR